MATKHNRAKVEAHISQACMEYGMECSRLDFRIVDYIDKKTNKPFVVYQAMSIDGHEVWTGGNSSNHADLFNKIDIAISQACENNKASFASSKVEDAHERGNYDEQGMTYKKDGINFQALDELIALNKKNIDFVKDDLKISDNDLRLLLDNNTIENIVSYLIKKHATKLEYLENLDCNSKIKIRENKNLKFYKDLVLTNHIYNKIIKVKERLEQLQGV